jgi:enoyl-CoA hydratase/carnithine racemase
MAYVRYSVEDGVAILVIENPPVNALSKPVMEELDKALDELRDNSSVKVVILTAAGQIAWIAGADINEIEKLNTKEEAYQVVKQAQGIVNKLENLGKPSIAAIHSLCLGGGLELALACTFRIAGDKAKFGQPEINLGIIPGMGGTQRLTRLVGKANALRLILTGEQITAQEAFRIGLVDAVVPSDRVIMTAKDFAKRIAQKGLPSIRAALRAVYEGEDLPLNEGLDLEAKLFAELCETEDKKEGIRAFKEKRRPNFQDR